MSHAAPQDPSVARSCGPQSTGVEAFESGKCSAAAMRPSSEFDAGPHRGGLGAQTDVATSKASSVSRRTVRTVRAGVTVRFSCCLRV